jgi:hypothetical protein
VGSYLNNKKKSKQLIKPIVVTSCMEGINNSGEEENLQESEET